VRPGQKPGYAENELKNKDRIQVFFKRYRSTTLVKHLGNLLRSTRIQKHHLINLKRPRTPLKLPNLRYRTRD